MLREIFGLGIFLTRVGAELGVMSRKRPDAKGLNSRQLTRFRDGRELTHETTSIFAKSFVSASAATGRLLNPMRYNFRRLSVTAHETA
jgi:hypothetical protein